MSRKNTDTGNRLLQAALDLLEESRGREVRMTDIARRAGISRQALYLHFPTRAALLIATTHYVDELMGAEVRLAPSRAATGGPERLDAFIEAWGNYIPAIYGVARALLAMKHTDDDAAHAWNTRMADMRQGCEAAITALKKDNMLTPEQPPSEAVDILWTLLSVRNWEHLTLDCAWPQDRYIATLKSMARRLFVKHN